MSYSGKFCISLRGLTNHGVNFLSLCILTNYGVNFIPLRGLTNHSVNFLSLCRLTNHGIDATDSQRTIYVKAHHILMASSSGFKDLLTERDQYRSQGSSINKLCY